MTTRELLQMARDALESRVKREPRWTDDEIQVIDAIRAHLAKPEPEPVAWVIECTEVDEDGVPIRRRDIDWNESLVDELPIDTKLYALKD